MTVAEYRSFEAEVKAELAPFDGVIEGFRSVKRPEEIECLRAAWISRRGPLTRS